MFREEWFPEQSQTKLADLVKSTPAGGLVVEVGSWEGRSTCALARAIHPEIVHAVDTWEGSPGEISADLAAERDVFATWQTNITELTDGNVEAHRMGWREFFDGFDEPIRLLFIDAEHTYVEVRDNILAALPYMEPGGIICGDDVHHPPVQQAVLETLGNAKVAATLWYWRVPGGTDGD